MRKRLCALARWICPAIFAIALTGCLQTFPGPTQPAVPPQGDLSGEALSGLSAGNQTKAPSPGIPAARRPAEPIEADDGEEEACPTAEPDASQPKNLTALDHALEFCQVAQSFWQQGELDSALEALDEAYALILTVDTADAPKLIQQKEDLRLIISRRILEIYASRNIVVNGEHNAIPLEMNRHIEAEIKLLTGRERQFFIRSYKRSGRYRPQIVAALEEAGLPQELSWLPLIESGYMTNALSPARALGLWQFIPSTGYKFGLSRDTHIDERLDPIKSTKAAIAYLTALHKIFGDWNTVLAAYNCGEGRVLRLIRSQNINYLDNFWDLYERLPLETARYVPRFLATLHIVAEPQKYGLTDLDTDPPMEYETVTVTRAMHLRDAARAIGVSEKELRELNPELRYHVLPGDAYALRVPPKKGEPLLAGLDRIPVVKAPHYSTVRHRVRRGETLSTIAARYRTSISRIMQANNLSRKNYIVAGQVLKIPARVAASSGSSAVVSAADATAGEHRVQRGDSLWTISQRYKTTVNALRRHNNLTSNVLSVGQVLQIPGRAPATDAGTAAEAATATAGAAEKAPRFTVHVVKSGDSLWNIARRYDTTVHKIYRHNHLRSNTLRIGQILKIPTTAAVPGGDETPRTYRVRRGDNPYTIAEKHGMSLEQFLQINQLPPRCKIFPGQEFLVQ